MKKTFLIISICFGTLSFVFGQSEDKALEIESFKSQIQMTIESANSNYNQARKLYNEATLYSQSQTETINQKMDELKENIELYQKKPDANKSSLTEAKSLYQQAQGEIAAYEYDKANESIQKAYEYFLTVPIVSLLVTPYVFTPDDDGQNDILNIRTRVSSKQEIKSWECIIYQEIDKGKETNSVPVKIISNTGDVPKEISWNGVMDEGEKVNSASDFMVIVNATDVKDGVGTSVQARFRTGIFVKETKRGFLIDVSSIRFEFNSDELKPQYKAIVKEVYDLLAKYPDYTIAVEGHSDSVGKAAYNLTLSKQRAESVARYLIELGLPESKVLSYGLGEALPRTLNKEKIDLNRRVNFFLLKNQKLQTKYENSLKKINTAAEIKIN